MPSPKDEFLLAFTGSKTGEADLAAGQHEVSPQALIDAANALQAVSVSLYESVDLVADLPTDLADGARRVVDSDTDANNGLYKFTAGSPGSWAKTALQYAPKSRVDGKKLPNLFRNGALANSAEGVTPRDTQAGAFAGELTTIGLPSDLTDLGIGGALDLSAVTTNRLINFPITARELYHAQAGRYALVGVLVYNSAAFSGVTSYSVKPWWGIDDGVDSAAGDTPVDAENQYVQVSTNVRFYYWTGTLTAPPAGVGSLLFGQQGRTGGSGDFLVSGLFCALSEAELTIDDVDYLDHRTPLGGREAVEALESRVANVEQGPRGRVQPGEDDAILFVGNSYTAGFASLAGKDWMQLVSAFTGYRCINYGVGGETLKDRLHALRGNTPNFHGSIGPRDQHVRFAWIMLYQNDLKYVENLVEYQEDLRAMIELCQSLGAEVIVSTEWQDRYEAVNTNLGAQGAMKNAVTAMQATAEKYGARFVDLLHDAVPLRSTDPRNNSEIYAGFWSDNHPGTRTNALLADPIAYHIKRSLPAPSRAVKVFRPRSTFSFGSITDLMYSTALARHARWKEIQVGQRAITTATAQYFDELDDGNQALENLTDEYLNLINGDSVSITDQALVEFATPVGGADTLKITGSFSASDVTLRLWDFYGGTHESDTRYNAAYGTGSLSGVADGDVYRADDGAFSGSPVDFTVVYDDGDFLVLNPAGGDTWSADHHTATSGTLTRISGSGPASISYDFIGAGAPAEYYQNLGKPEGAWTDVLTEAREGVWEVSGAARYMRDGKVYAIFEKSGAWNMTGAPVLEYTGGALRVPQPLGDFQYPKTTGSELLTETLFDASAIANWTASGGVSTTAPADGITPYGTTGVATFGAGDYVEEVVTTTNSGLDDFRQSRRLYLEVWSRHFPAIFASSGNTFPDDSEITEDTSDYVELKITIGDPSTPGFAEITERVGLWYKACRFEFVAPRDIASLPVRIEAVSGDTQVAYASLKALA